MKFNSKIFKWLPMMVLAVLVSVALFSVAVPALAELVGLRSHVSVAPTVERIPANDRDLN